ncbi:MAG: PQQ-dependent sugar dehydrogenase, partial [Methylophilaceae bacterium]|nr:PQQ-dependent sugar dehydrogenase [Methylophilaceae bacterium]
MVSELVSFIKKNNFLIFIIIYTPVLVLAETIIDDYRKYDVTKTKFTLEKSAKDLSYPWALSFIDKTNVVITEKDGGLYKVDVLSGKKQKIKHNIPHIGYDGGGQGGLLDVYFNPSDSYIYFTYSHKSSKLTRSKKL